jgi:hypothetical protein
MLLKITAFWDIVPCSSLNKTDVSEMHTASIIRAMILNALMMEGEHTSQTSVFN